MSLNVPLFIAVSDVVERMQLDDSLAGVDALVSSALMGAQLAIEKLLGGRIAQRSIDTTFFLDASSFSGIQPGGFFRLELPNSFIRTDSPVIVTFDGTWNLANPQTMVSTDFMVDYDRGYVMVDSQRPAQNDFGRFYMDSYGNLGNNTSYRNKWVRVQCQSGFNPSVPTPSFTGTPSVWDGTTIWPAGAAVTYQGQTYVAVQQNQTQVPFQNATYWTPVTYGPEAIPNEVYEAIMTYIPLLLNADQGTKRNPEAAPQYKTLTDHAMMLLRDYMRMKGFSFRPVR